MEGQRESEREWGGRPQSPESDPTSDVIFGPPKRCGPPKLTVLDDQPTAENKEHKKGQPSAVRGKK